MVRFLKIKFLILLKIIQFGLFITKLGEWMDGWMDEGRVDGWMGGKAGYGRESRVY